MKPIKVLCFFLLSVMAGLSNVYAQQKSEATNCRAFDVSINTISATENRSNGEIKIESNEKLREIKYVFCDKRGFPINLEDLKNSRLDNLANGLYYCFLNDQNGCSEKIEINLR
jgi:hypothetical protein